MQFITFYFSNFTVYKVCGQFQQGVLDQSKGEDSMKRFEAKETVFVTCYNTTACGTTMLALAIENNVTQCGTWSVKAGVKVRHRSIVDSHVSLN